MCRTDPIFVRVGDEGCLSAHDWWYLCACVSVVVCFVPTGTDLQTD